MPRHIPYFFIFPYPKKVQLSLKVSIFWVFHTLFTIIINLRHTIYLRRHPSGRHFPTFEQNLQAAWSRDADITQILLDLLTCWYCFLWPHIQMTINVAIHISCPASYCISCDLIILFVKLLWTASCRISVLSVTIATSQVFFHGLSCFTSLTSSL
jgi:hypothetical protein